MWRHQCTGRPLGNQDLLCTLIPPSYSSTGHSLGEPLAIKGSQPKQCSTSSCFPSRSKKVSWMERLACQHPRLYSGICTHSLALYTKICWWYNQRTLDTQADKVSYPTQNNHSCCSPPPRPNASTKISQVQMGPYL